MDEFLEIPNLITALIVGFSTGVITWLISKSQFRRNLKKEEGDRLREHLHNYLDSFLNFRRLMSKHQRFINELLEIEKNGPEINFEEKISKIENELESIHNEFDALQFKINSVAYKLTMYDLDDYSKEIADHINEIQKELDNVGEVITLIDPINLPLIFRNLDENFKEKYLLIEKATKAIYPK